MCVLCVCIVCVMSQSPSIIRGMCLMSCVELRYLMFEKTFWMFGPQMRPEGINTRICGGAIRTHRSLCRMWMVMVPPICNLLTTRSTSPHRAWITRWCKHIVIRHCMMITYVTHVTAAMQWMVMMKKPSRQYIMVWSHRSTWACNQQITAKMLKIWWTRLFVWICFWFNFFLHVTVRL